MSMPAVSEERLAATCRIEEGVRRHDSMLGLTVRKFLRHKFAVAGLIVLVDDRALSDSCAEFYPGSESPLGG